MEYRAVEYPAVVPDPVRLLTQYKCKALWRSWLARRPVTAEVAGSSPVRVASLARHLMLERVPSGQVAQLVRASA